MKYIRRITVILFAAVFAVWLFSAVLAHRTSDDTPPVITSDTEELVLSVRDGEESLLKGLTASDDKDGDLTSEILVGEKSNFKEEKGVTEVTYLVFDQANNVGEYTRKVRYQDYQSPSFTLSSPLIFERNSKVTVLDRLGATDCLEGDISSRIRILSGDIDNTANGDYTIGVEITNRFGDSVSADLPVHVVDSTKNLPVITLTHYLVCMQAGTEFYPEQYLASVKDSAGNEAGLEYVQISSGVNGAVPGVYEVLYTMTDGAGKTGETCLTVLVRE